MTKRRRIPRMCCPYCRGWFGFYVPYRGDGSGVRLRAHDAVVQRRRGFGWVRERCAGSYACYDATAEVRTF